MLKKFLLKTSMIGLLVVVLAGCSASSMKSHSIANQELKKESVSEMTTADTVVSEMEEARGDGIKLSTTMNLNRKIIKNGNLHIETKTFDETVEAIMAQVEKLGGFMQSCTIEGDSSHTLRSERTANLIVRIPSEKFDNFMNDTDNYGNVVTKSIEGEDVTDQYMDTEMRLQVLEIQSKRLQELLKQAGELEDLFAIEKELADVTYQIESLKGTLKKYDSLVDYGTISLYVSETRVYKIEPQEPVTFSEKVTYQLTQSFKNVGKFLTNTTIGIIAFIPYLIIILPIGLMSWIILKKIRKNKLNKLNKKE